MVAYTMLRTPTAEEQERMHGFPSKDTSVVSNNDASKALLTEDERKSLLGNSFSCVAVAVMLGSWAVNEGMLRKEPTVKDIWAKAKSLEPSLPKALSLSQCEDAVRFLQPPTKETLCNKEKGQLLESGERATC